MRSRLLSLRNLVAAAAFIAPITASVMTASSAWAYNGTISGYYDGTREVVAFADATGALSLAHYDYNGNPWQWETIAQEGTSQFTGAFLVGSQVTAYYDGTKGHVSWLGNLTNGCYYNYVGLFDSPGNPPTSTWTDITGQMGWTGNSCQLPNPGHYNVEPTPAWSTYADVNGHWVTAVTNPSTLANITPGSGTDYLYYASANDSKIHEVYGNAGSWSADGSLGNNSWSQTVNGANMTAITSGANLHVFYVGENSQYQTRLYELYYNGNGWWQGYPTYDIEGYFSAVSLRSTDEHIFGYDAAHSSMELEYYLSGWYENSLSGTTCNGTSPTVSYDFSGYGAYFCSQGGKIYYSYSGGTAVQLSLPVAASANLITGFQAGSYCHLFYIGTDAHVHEMYSYECSTTPSNWGTTDVTSSSGAPNAWVN